MRPTRFWWITSHSFLLSIDRALDREALARAAGVESGTYAAEIVDRLLCCVFGGLVDLIAEYAVYYEREYPSLQHFLERRYGLPETVADAFSNESDEGRLLGRGHVFCGGDYVVGQWIELKAGDRALRRILQCAEDEGGEEAEEFDED